MTHTSINEILAPFVPVRLAWFAPNKYITGR